MTQRIWLTVAGLVTVGVAAGGLVVFSWMISETHFDRPDDGFDRLAAQVEALPGVSVDGRERWVEAPSFADPSSWIGVTVDEADVPQLLAAACTTEYADTVSWSFRMQSDRGNVVSVHGDSASSDSPRAPRCPDFGVDATGLVGAIDRGASGLNVQVMMREDDRFALVSIDDDPAGIRRLLPLVDHADALLDAAGLDADRSVEINAGTLSVIIEPDERDRYLALLTDLVEEHGVTSFWADGGGTPIDGVEKVQVIAPDGEHSAIQDRIRASGLHIAEWPVRFIPA